jgi:branched-chain amino acid transport system substrate-binding protein
LSQETPEPVVKTRQSWPLIAILVALVIVAAFIIPQYFGQQNANNGNDGHKSSTTGHGSSTSPVPTPAANIITIGSDLPTSGAYAGVGLPTQNAVQLAIQQATLPKGYKLQYYSKNDVNPLSGSYDSQTGVTNIEALIADPSVLGIVGPFNSSVAKAEIPFVNAATMTLISPTATNPGLTLEQYAADNGINWAQAHPVGKPDCFFRLPGNDVVQGKLLADIALQSVPGKKPAFHTVYIVDDDEIYGVELAHFFQAEFTNKGGVMVGHDSITQNQPSTLNALAAKIKAAKPDFVFYGGLTSGGGATLKADLGPQIFLEGGDGIADDPAWLTAAGAGAANTFGTIAAPATSTFTNGAAAKFASDYQAAFSSAPLPYSAEAYDATNILIAAIIKVIEAGKVPTRSNVRDTVAAIHFNGVTGMISFDQHGDNSGTKAFSVYAVNGNGTAWQFQQEVPING